MVLAIPMTIMLSFQLSGAELLSTAHVVRRGGEGRVAHDVHCEQDYTSAVASAAVIHCGNSLPDRSATM